MAGQPFARHLFQARSTVRIFHSIIYMDPFSAYDKEKIHSVSTTSLVEWYVVPYEVRVGNADYVRE